MRFSEASAARLRWFLQSIDRRNAPAERWRFITLTYRTWRKDAKVWKRNLDAWRKAFERRYGRCPMVWKLEFQKRGAPHFHLAVLLGSEFTSLEVLAEMREWCGPTWARIVGAGVVDPVHARVGTEVARVRSWRGVASYCSEYLCKNTVSPLVDEETGEVKSCGRLWGKFREEEFPREIVRSSLNVACSKFLQRTIRRYLEHTRPGLALKWMRPKSATQAPVDIRVFINSEFIWRVLDHFKGEHQAPEDMCWSVREKFLAG